jgi:hypothetical protein
MVGLGGLFANDVGAGGALHSGPFGEDSDLQRWGLRLAERGGKNAKKRAVVAVAGKLAVLELGTPTMHRAKIAQPRSADGRMATEAPGSNRRNPQEEKEKEEKNTLDSYRPPNRRG